MRFRLEAEFEADDLAEAIRRSGQLPQSLHPSQLASWLRAYRLESIDPEDGVERSVELLVGPAIPAAEPYPALPYPAYWDVTPVPRDASRHPMPLIPSTSYPVQHPLGGYYIT